MRSFSRIAGGIGWTAVLAVALLGADRLLLGEIPGPRWREVSRVEQAEAIVGRVIVPRYLPETLGWPPSRILVRSEAPGWWLGLAPADEPVALWIGVGDSPLPSALQSYQGCLDPSATTACPAGWSALSTPLPDGSAVFLIYSVSSSEIARVAEGLAPGAR